MNKEEVNKIIADYMEIVIGHNKCSCANIYKYNESNFWCPQEKKHSTNIKGLRYTKSLDELVPVWEKLGCSISLGKCSEGKIMAILMDEMNSTGFGESNQEAAAIATAKAILELNKTHIR